MNLINNLTARLPFIHKAKELEYFFAANFSPERILVALWTVEDNKLKILEQEEANYATEEELFKVLDSLLDKVLGEKQVEPEKILFGVPDSWLSDEDLKPTYLDLLRKVVKDLELKPMAYVATSHALSHLLENKEGAPTTAILVGIEDNHLVVIVVRAGKFDGVKVINRGDNLGQDIEKTLLTFTDVEVLPSRILIFGGLKDLDKHKSNLLSFPWMSKLSFLHFPKIDILEKNIEVKAVSFAGAVEANPSVKYIPSEKEQSFKQTTPLYSDSLNKLEPKQEDENDNLEDSGFIVGDITEKKKEAEVKDIDEPGKDEMSLSDEDLTDEYLQPAVRSSLPINPELTSTQKFTLAKTLPLFLRNLFSKVKIILLLPLLITLVIILAYLFLPKAQILVFVEPRVLEKDTQVTADPATGSIDEENKKIPGQIVETQVNGSEKGQATGKKQVGESAEGVVMVRNKTNEYKTFNKGVILVGPGGLKFTLDSNATVASASATDGTWGKVSMSVTALSIGPDGNLPSGSELKFTDFSTSSYIAEAEGNFSGGTSKEVTVVSDGDQKKLLATLASNLRKKAQEELQAKLQDKKILEEALAEEIIKKSYSKNINDQASEFNLNMTIKYKGTAFSETDLKTIVSKLVSTNVPENFQINLAETETQADVSKIEKDGKLIFLARFRAKLMPKIDSDAIRIRLKGKTPQQAAEILKSYENVLGSEIKITPFSLPGLLQRLPLFENNIKVEVGLK